MSPLLAIDPGTTETAFVILSAAGTLLDHAKLQNARLLGYLNRHELHFDLLAVEMVASYGMPVGAEVFETCVWIGRFVEAAARPFRLIPRAAVKMHLCHRTAGVNDGVIRQRLIDLYGGKAQAIGNKKQQGPLYGVSGDVWQALALGITAQQAAEKELQTA